MLLPTTSYRTEPFALAARALGVEPMLGTDRCQRIDALWPDEATIALDFRDPEDAAARIVRLSRERRVAAIVPTSEETAVIAALAASALGLPHNPPDAARATRDKYVMRERFAAAGVSQPRFRLLDVDADPERLAEGVELPCVLKPRHLQASRGVIRADDRASFVAGFRRLAALLRLPDVAAKGGPLARSLLCESYVAGVEVAVEGIVTDGRFEVLAIFDKPDPLVGPFFEESIYVTPSRLPDDTQRVIADATARAAAAIGLRHGPVHAELRWNGTASSVIELAARTIGGLCSRTLRFGAGISLEELVLRHALGEDIGALGRESRAAGVMMIPVPRAGVLAGVSGIDEAAAVRGIEEIAITMKIGEKLVPSPEGGAYPGFIFARGETPAFVEAALREALGRLRFAVAPLLLPASAAAAKAAKAR